MHDDLTLIADTDSVFVFEIGIKYWASLLILKILFGIHQCFALLLLVSLWGVKS